MMISANQIRLASKSKVNESNMESVLLGLEKYGKLAGLDLPHRYVQYLAQLMHESGAFRYDRELWGPTEAQKRYDVRTDLGNTPTRDGDGKLYLGRTAGQITGLANYSAFLDWARKKGLNPPDFVKKPDLLNTDPWEGLGPIWYWDVGNPERKSLNRHADKNDIEMITRRWNGGLNGYEDRLDYYTRLGLVVLGFGPTEISAFQSYAQHAGLYKGKLDGDDGPQTRAAIHLALSQIGAETSPVVVDVKPAPVTEEKKVPVTPPSMDAPWWQSKEVLVPAAGGGLTSALTALGAIPWQNLLIFLGFIAIGAGFLYWRKRADAKVVKAQTDEVAS